MKSFHGCTALITGASAGFGVEFARQLAPRARTLILVARRLERLEQLKEELLRSQPELRVYSYGLDLGDAAAIDEFLRWLWNEGLRVNFLINNAGLGDHGEFQSAEWEKVQLMLDVNIDALTKLTHRLLPMLRTFPSAAILNVSSIASFMPVPNLTVYAATKAYVSSFTEGLRAELRGTGVSVTAVCPGPVDTEFAEHAARQERRFHSPALLKISPAEVVEKALAAVARDRARVVPGLFVALAMCVVTLVPMFLLRLLLALGARRAHERLSAPVR